MLRKMFSRIDGIPDWTVETLTQRFEKNALYGYDPVIWEKADPLLDAMVMKEPLEVQCSTPVGIPIPMLLGGIYTLFDTPYSFRTELDVRRSNNLNNPLENEDQLIYAGTIDSGSHPQFAQYTADPTANPKKHGYTANEDEHNRTNLYYDRRRDAVWQLINIHHYEEQGKTIELYRLECLDATQYTENSVNDGHNLRRLVKLLNYFQVR